MSPLPRTVLPGVPLHVTQRGVNRWPTFLEDIDFAFYRAVLSQAADAESCAVHAYVLMTNHVHLLITPPDGNALSRMMQSIGRRYVRHFNDRYRRTGCLWEGRYRSGHIKDDAHLLACHRYIEDNPVRARMITDPAEYEWSSFRRNALGRPDEVVRSHPLYDALAARSESRRKRYRELFGQQLEPQVIAAFRAGTSGRFDTRTPTYQQCVKALNDRLIEKHVRLGEQPQEVALPWPAFPAATFASS